MTRAYKMYHLWVKTKFHVSDKLTLSLQRVTKVSWHRYEQKHHAYTVPSALWMEYIPSMFRLHLDEAECCFTSNEFSTFPFFPVSFSSIICALCFLFLGWHAFAPSRFKGTHSGWSATNVVKRLCGNRNHRTLGRSHSGWFDAFIVFVLRCAN